MNFEKLLHEKAFNNYKCNPFNFLQVCPSVPPFVFAVLIKPSFEALWSYFSVSLSLVAVPPVWSLITIFIRLTALGAH